MENEQKLFMITTYKPSYNLMEKTIKSNWLFTQKSKATRKLYDYKIIKVNRRAKSIKDYVVRSKLDYHPEEGKDNDSTEKEEKERRALCTNGCRVCPILSRRGKLK